MSARGSKLELATRGSALARRQAATVRQRLAERRIKADLVEVETTGDQVRDELIHQLGTTGAFVRSLDERVLSGDLDAAVHSMKDMPTEQPEGLVVAAVLERGPPGDLLVTPGGTDLADLPEGATVGTSSLRRRAQLLAARPELDVAGLRGNVDTRVEKLLAPRLRREHRRRLEAAGELGPDDEQSSTRDDDEQSSTRGDDEQSSTRGNNEQSSTGGDDKQSSTEDDSAGEPADGGDEVGDREFDRTPEEWFESLAEIERRALEREVSVEYDAVCLAAAGLERSGLRCDLETEALDPGSFVPAPAQGAIAVTAREGDTAERIHDAIDHPLSRVEVTAERTVLAELGGGCVAPVGVYARLEGSVVTTTVRVLSQDGTETVGKTRELPVERHAAAAAEFAGALAERGATELVDRARRDQPDDAKRG